MRAAERVDRVRLPHLGEATAHPEGRLGLLNHMPERSPIVLGLRVERSCCVELSPDSATMARTLLHALRILGKDSSSGSGPSPTRGSPAATKTGRDDHAPCSLEAVFTTSPATIPSPSSGRAPNATTASPVLIPIRTDSSSSGREEVSPGIVSRIRSPARTARSASSSCAIGGSGHGHDRVPDELLDRASVALDLVAKHLMEGPKRGPDVLGIRLVRACREPDEVAEEDRDDLAFPGDRRGRCSFE
jgi:hypothetical protein